jgi:hypothetical protein
MYRPHYYHTTIGIEAFAAGLHVLTEKPISGEKKSVFLRCHLYI